MTPIPILFLLLSITLAYLPTEGDPHTRTQLAKFYFILGSGFLVGLWGFLKGHGVARYAALVSALLLALGSFLPPTTAPGRWFWGGDLQFYSQAVAGWLGVAGTAFGLAALRPKGNATAIVAWWLLLTFAAGWAGARGWLEAFGYAPYGPFTKDFFPTMLTWPSPGYLAGALAFGAAYVLGSRKGYLGLAAAAAAAALMLAGGNRSGPLGFFLALLFLVFTWPPPVRTRRLIAFTLLTAALFLAYPKPPKAVPTFARLDQNVSTLNSRTYLWKAAWAVLKRRPLGVGPDGFASALSQAAPEELIFIVRKFGFVPKEAREVRIITASPMLGYTDGSGEMRFVRVREILAHNAFLDWALAYGLPVAVSLYAIWLAFLVWLYRRGEWSLFAPHLAFFVYLQLWPPIFPNLFIVAMITALHLAAPGGAREERSRLYPL